MPFYISRYIGRGVFDPIKRIHDPFRPVGFSQRGAKAYDLRPDGGATLDGGGLNACLLWLPVHDPDPALEQLAVDPTERLSATTAQRVSSRLGTTVPAGSTSAVVRDLMLNPPVNGWRAPIPAAGGTFTVRLGPITERIVPIRGGAKALIEQWPVGDSSDPDGELNWSELTGTGWGVTGQRCRNAGNTGFSYIHVPSELDTVNMELQIDLMTWTPNNVAMIVHLFGRADATDANGYGLGGFVDNLGVGASYFIFKTVATVDTILDTVATTPTSGDKLRLQLNGSTQVGWINDVQSVDSGDTAVSTGKWSGIHGICFDAGQVLEVDNFRAYDITPTRRSGHHYQTLAAA